MLATNGGTASIICTCQSIIAINRAYHTSSIAASCSVAEIWRVADDLGVIASTGRRSQFSAVVNRARIAIVALGKGRGGTARKTGSLAHAAPICVRAIQANGGSELNLRLGGVAFAIEEIDEVVGSDDEGRSNVIEIDRHTHSLVERTEINYQHVVNVYPHVIITGEGKDLAALEPKSRVALETVREIVVVAVVVPALTVDREKAAVGISVSISLCRHKGEVVVDGDGLVGEMEPRVEGVGGARVVSGAAARGVGVGVDGSAVVANLAAVSPAVSSITLSSNNTFFSILVGAKSDLKVGVLETLPAVG